jgi:hypothetical protein
MSTKSGSRGYLLTPLVLCAAMLAGEPVLAGHGAESAGSAWNRSSDPNALYGQCGSAGSGLRAKYVHVHDVGESLENVLAITVLKCAAFSASGPHKIACPAGSPYAYCTNTGNDGLGNDITLGVTKLDARTDPNGIYTGCPTGARVKPKLGLVIAAGRDPRLVKGIVTLSCTASRQRQSARPVPVACPAGPGPYGGNCLATPNDGFGNAVTIGVIAAKEAGDPYALYGECLFPLDGDGVRPGFMAKSTLVAGVGRSVASVRSIDIVECSAPSGLGAWFPNHLESGPCGTIQPGFLPPGIASRYQYCVWGTDGKGNGVVAGINR